MNGKALLFEMTTRSGDIIDVLRAANRLGLNGDVVMGIQTEPLGKANTIKLFGYKRGGDMNGWICEKCGYSWALWIDGCRNCNKPDAEKPKMPYSDWCVCTTSWPVDTAGRCALCMKPKSVYVGVPETGTTTGDPSPDIPDTTTTNEPPKPLTLEKPKPKPDGGTK